MLATRASDPRVGVLPHGDDWAYEVKWDGVRCLADTTSGELRLRARTGRDITVAYPELAGLAQVQGAVLDGEIVVLRDGSPSFEALAERMHVRDAARARRLAGQNPVTYMLFDVLTLYGVDVTRRTFDERRATLERLTLPACAQLSPVYPDGDVLWQVTREHGLEGVVAKRRTAPYQPGRRSPDWVKAAHRSARTAAVVGVREEKSATGRLGAVLLAAPDVDGAWRYLGKAGSGLAGRRGADLLRALRGAERSTTVLTDAVPAADARGASWYEPVVLVDVAYLQRTRTGRLRHPVVRSLRTDGTIDPWEEQ